MDDLIIMGSQEEITLFKKKLKNKLTIKELGFPKEFLGISLTRGSGSVIHMTQPRMILSTVKEWGLAEANPTTIPLAMGTSEALEAADQGNPDTNNAFRRGVGLLGYLVLGTRPDIAICYKILSRYLGKECR